MLEINPAIPYFEQPKPVITGKEYDKLEEISLKGILESQFESCIDLLNPDCQGYSILWAEKSQKTVQVQIFPESLFGENFENIERELDTILYSHFLPTEKFWPHKKTAQRKKGIIYQRTEIPVSLGEKRALAIKELFRNQNGIQALIYSLSYRA